MAKSLVDKYSFRTGALRTRELAYILVIDDKLSEDQLPHTIYCMLNKDKWSQDLVKWSANSSCVVKTPKEQFIAIGEYGNAYILGSGEKLDEVIGKGDNSPKKRGALREVRNIGGKAYVCGMDRQVYRRDATDTWTCVDGDMRHAESADIVFGFESIHGFDEKEIYAVGWFGEIWQYDGKKWVRHESPTNLILTKVFCAPDGNVYICGQRGTLIKGRGSKWEIIAEDSTDHDLWDLQWYSDKLYLSSMRLIYTLEDDELKYVDTGDEIAETCYHLDAADGILWSIGAKDILQFDGHEWKRIQ